MEGEWKRSPHSLQTWWLQVAAVKRHIDAVKAVIETGGLDDVVHALHKRRQQLQWERLPSRIILVRHGQSEGNVNHHVYSVKGDSRVEVRLTRSFLPPLGQRKLVAVTTHTSVCSADTQGLATSQGSRGAPRTNVR